MKLSALLLALTLSVFTLGCGDSDEPAQQRVGFEILERLPDGQMRAWVNTGNITREEFDALELPENWMKNQPRESGGTGAAPGGISSEFLRSPDAAPGEYDLQEHFGFQWFHAATVVQIGVPIGADGVLIAVRVRKYHEYTIAPGTPILLLVSPEGDAYFRNGRDATRTVDDPTLPDGWRLVDYAPNETLVVELWPENLVIRADNQDSFQGPVPQLKRKL